MGRVKELYMDHKNALLWGPEYPEFLAYMHDLASQPTNTDILCPNCTKSNLIFTSTSEVDCPKCGQQFIMINPKTVRYK
jgi:predicted RNA-binding Zn-ribbon protein involved in translation (DUF1610 family)